MLDTPPSEIYDVLCALAAKTYACPIAGVTFLDAKRQWFKARVGLKQAEIARDVALCAPRDCVDRAARGPRHHARRPL